MRLDKAATVNFKLTRSAIERLLTYMRPKRSRKPTERKKP